MFVTINNDQRNLIYDVIAFIPGIVPRAIYKLFDDLNQRKTNNPSYEFEMFVSFLELYNEDLIDLLNPQSRESNKKGKSDLMIREDANGQIYWAGVKEVAVSSPDELLEYVFTWKKKKSIRLFRLII